MADVRELAKRAQEYAAQIGGCGDGGCAILKPIGQHTNGGCHCVLHLNDDRLMTGRVENLLRHYQALMRAALQPEKADD